MTTLVPPDRAPLAAPAAEAALARLARFERSMQLLRRGCANAPDLDAETMTLYEQALGHLTADELTAAVTHYVTTRKFWPTPSELLDAAAELAEQAAGIEDAPTAWGMLMSAFQKGYSSYRHPHFANDLINQALTAIGGWRLLCMSKEEDVASHRARFIEAYNIYLQRQRAEARQHPAVRAYVARLATARPTGPAITPAWELGQRPMAAVEAARQRQITAGSPPPIKQPTRRERPITCPQCGAIATATVHPDSNSHPAACPTCGEHTLDHDAYLDARRVYMQCLVPRGENPTEPTHSF